MLVQLQKQCARENSVAVPLGNLSSVQHREAYDRLRGSIRDWVRALQSNLYNRTLVQPCKDDARET